MPRLALQWVRDSPTASYAPGHVHSRRDLAVVTHLRCDFDERRMKRSLTPFLNQLAFTRNEKL